MPSRLEDRLRAARDYLFVGRRDELLVLNSALDVDPLPFQVLHVHGPAGIGKTALLRAYQRHCMARSIPATYLDARDTDPTPDSFLSVLCQALNLALDAEPLDELARRGERHVLLVDTFDAVGVLDSWLRDHFLPRLPDHVLIVLARRDQPPPPWRVDPGWRSLMRTLALRNLDSEASRMFLRRRAVPEGQHEAVLAFTHGHPLATSLVADLLDQQPGADFEPQDAPDVIHTLMVQFVQKVQSPAHRATLEACSLVHFTTEAVLQALLAMPDVHELFMWLRSISFIDAGPRGLFPHDLAREVLAADLRWRNPAWHAELHRRARQFYTESLKNSGPVSERNLLSDYAFLHRDHPLVRPFFTRLRSQWSDHDILPDRMQPADRHALLAMVTRHEGEAAARIARHWFDRQPTGVIVYRDKTGTPLGFMTCVSLDAASDEDRGLDPATVSAWAYLQNRAPLRTGEHATFFRFWMAEEAYQGVSPVQSLIFVSRVRHYLSTPGLAFTFLPCRDPDFWGPIFAFGAMERLPGADYEVGNHMYAVFGHDWRALPPMAWLDLIADTMPGGLPDAPGIDPVIVLSRSDFDEAVHNAFRAYARPGTLRGNPLLRSRLVTDRTGLDADEADRIEALQRHLEDTAEALQAHPREATYYRAVHRTYLQPAPTQEQAAELLDLPFSTYRRHLKRGLERIAELLWQHEIGAL